MKINIKEKKQDKWLLWTVVFLVALGLPMLLIASSPEVGYSYFLRQAAKLVPGVLILLFMSYFNYRHLQKLAWFLMGTSFLLLLYTKLWGDFRWISIGPISFQVADFARFSVIVFLADYIDKNYKNMNQFLTGIVFPVLVVSPIALLIWSQPDLSTAMVLMAIVFSLLFVGGTRLVQFSTTVLLAGSSFLIFALNRGNYWTDRIVDFANGILGIASSDDSATVFHATQAEIALNQGGLSGMLGAGTQKLGYLPEQYSDFIFAIVGEELGFIGTTILIIAYMIIFYRVIQIAKNSNDIFGIILTIGFGLSITYYAFVHIGYVVGMLPVTGIPLPFISHGGSALIMNLLMIGILLNISKAQRKLNVKEWRPRIGT